MQPQEMERRHLLEQGSSNVKLLHLSCSTPRLVKIQTCRFLKWNSFVASLTFDQNQRAGGLDGVVLDYREPGQNFLLVLCLCSQLRHSR